MIDAAGIPRIEGDMQVLAEHARALQGLGPDITDSGESVYRTWQGLAPGYDAPEAGQLLAATGPVKSVSAAIGEDVAAAGTVLGTYATPDYPNGYYRYYNSQGQPLDVNGTPGSRDATHISEDYQGVIKGWPE